MKRIVFIASLLFVFSCEKAIKLTQEEVAPGIVVNSVNTAGDSCIIDLSESRELLYNGPLPKLTTANAKLLDQNGNTIAGFVHTGDGQYVAHAPSLLLAGNTYKLNVSNANFKSVEASTTIPSVLTVSSIDTSYVASLGSKKFKIQFQDNPNQNNFYAVSIKFYSFFVVGTDTVFEEDDFHSTDEFYVDNGSRDIDGQLYSDEFFFSDELFQGQNITYTGYQTSDNQAQAGSYYVVRVLSMSEDLYKYKLTLSKYLSAKDDFFAEPVRVYSNIKNGSGIFGGYSEYMTTIMAQ